MNNFNIQTAIDRAAAIPDNAEILQAYKSVFSVCPRNLSGFQIFMKYSNHINLNDLQIISQFSVSEVELIKIFIIAGMLQPESKRDGEIRLIVVSAISESDFESFEFGEINEDVIINALPGLFLMSTDLIRNPEKVDNFVRNNIERWNQNKQPILYEAVRKLKNSGSTPEEIASNLDESAERINWYLDSMEKEVEQRFDTLRLLENFLIEDYALSKIKSNADAKQVSHMAKVQRIALSRVIHEISNGGSLNRSLSSLMDFSVN